MSRMNEYQLYQFQRRLVTLAVGLLIYGYTGARGVSAFTSQPQSLWFYPQFCLAILVTSAPHLLLMAIGARGGQVSGLQSGTSKYRSRFFAGFVVSGLLLIGVISVQTLTTAGVSLSWATMGVVCDQVPGGLVAIFIGLLELSLLAPILRQLSQPQARGPVQIGIGCYLVVLSLGPLAGFFLTGNVPAVRGLLFILMVPIDVLMGAWISRGSWQNWLTRQRLLGLWLGTAACFGGMLAVSMYAVNLNHNYDLILTQPFTQSLQFLPCVTIGLTVAVRQLNRPLRAPRPHNFLEGAYGVLLVAVLLLEPLAIVVPVLSPLLGHWLATWVWVGLTAVFSDWCVRLLRLFRCFRWGLPNLFK
ncbi:hypothetical protein [Lactiplantibacillus modestisalitolerans]|uniref:Polysaccharide biosynthesis protein n=1 Tax=Lactiplantibacillus modestisalitolerans TaxID=1457219 RepID=A0ABV5WUD5_9LACO|nr:hypothetical protein [Lactiplantibacillus modestisalitolerans]